MHNNYYAQVNQPIVGNTGGMMDQQPPATGNPFGNTAASNPFGASAASNPFGGG